MKSQFLVHSPWHPIRFLIRARVDFILKSLAWQLIACTVATLSASGQVPVVVGEQAADYATRYRATYALSRTLRTEDLAKLRAFLALPPASTALSEGELAALKNNVADALISHNPLPSGLDDELFAQYRDKPMGDLWRGFVVQKTAELALRLSEDEQRQAVDFLWARLQEPSGSFAAEAALGLERLLGKRPELVDSARLREELIAFVDNPERPAAARRILLQSLAERDPAAAASRARQFLSGDIPVLLKASAIATLGLVGTSSDLQLITPFLTSADLRLSAAADAARHRLSGRNTSTTR